MTLTSDIIYNYLIRISQNSVTISNFSMLTSTPNKLSASLSISMINPQTSIKSVQSNKVSIFRNGYLYNEAYFSFQVSAASIASISMSLLSNNANANTTLTCQLTFTYQILAADKLLISVPEDIFIYSFLVS
jgi:hypothetical protein